MSFLSKRGRILDPFIEKILKKRLVDPLKKKILKKEAGGSFGKENPK